MPKIQKPRPQSVREGLNSLVKPYNAYEDAPTIDKNRGTDVSTKGNRDKDISISLVDIDTAVIEYMQNKIKPNIVQNGERIPVPVIYGFPERWKAVQQDGFLRDVNGRILSPIIVVRRENITSNRTLGSKIDANSPHNFHVFEVPYTKKNSYDNFSALTNRKPVKEFQAVVVPEYVTLTYNCAIYTEHIAQNNKIVEAIQYASNAYWGDENRFKFRAMIDSFSTVTEYTQGEDRTSKTTFNIVLNGYIIPDTVNRDASYAKRFLSKAQLVFNLEVDGLKEIFNPTLGAKPLKRPEISGGKTQVSYVNTTSPVVAYLAKVVTKADGDVTVVANNKIRVLNSTISLAPQPLPPTDKTQFSVLINGQVVPNNYIVSVTQNALDVDIVIDITGAGYSYGLQIFEGNITVVGKFD